MTLCISRGRKQQVSRNRIGHLVKQFRGWRQVGDILIVNFFIVYITTSRILSLEHWKILLQYFYVCYHKSILQLLFISTKSCRSSANLYKYTNKVIMQQLFVSKNLPTFSNEGEIEDFVITKIMTLLEYVPMYTRPRDLEWLVWVS